MNKSIDTRLNRRFTSRLSKRTLLTAGRTIAPFFLALAVSSAAHAQGKREAAEAQAKQTNDLKAAQTKAEAYRSQYPGELHFDYAWDRKKADALGLQQVWRDDKFTYLRGHFQETPALYELKDGKGSLINFDFNDGLYTIPKTVLVGYLTIGKQRVEFHRTGTDHTEGSN